MYTHILIDTFDAKVEYLPHSCALGYDNDDRHGRKDDRRNDNDRRRHGSREVII